MYVFLSVILNIILKWFRAWENCVSNQNTINKKKGFCFQIYKYSVKQYLEQLRIIFCLLISWLKMSVTGWEETWWDANPGDPERWNRRQSVCLFDLGWEELTQTLCWHWDVERKYPGMFLGAKVKLPSSNFCIPLNFTQLPCPSWCNHNFDAKQTG